MRMKNEGNTRLKQHLWLKSSKRVRCEGVHVMKRVVQVGESGVLCRQRPGLPSFLFAVDIAHSVDENNVVTSNRF